MSILFSLIRSKQRQSKGMVGKSRELVFDSEFEEGNLDLVLKRNTNEYDLFMRTDSNTRGHHQWFYYSINNKVQGTFKFNILNFTKCNSLYQHGMRISVLSKTKSALAREGNFPKHYLTWHRGCDNILYEVSRLSTENNLKRPCSFTSGSNLNKAYYSLSFEYTFDYIEDTVYFAYSVPYTYTDMNKLLKEIESIENVKDFLTEDTLCKSLGGVNIPILTITENHSPVKKLEPIIDFPANLRYDELYIPTEQYRMIAKNNICIKKPVVFVTARIHPGETCGSFLMEGFLRYIISSDPTAIELRKNIIFKVIPMINPDGVILGNYRTSLCGQDLNRKFSNPNTHLHPEICAIKELIAKTKASGHHILGYFDFHGHSKKKCVFIYGPYYPLHSFRYLKVRVFAYLLSSATEMFRYRACKYNQEKEKMSAARLVISSEYDIMNSFTIESSFYGFINEERKTVEFDNEMYEVVGGQIGKTLWDYYNLTETEEANKIQKALIRKNKKQNKIVNKLDLNKKIIETKNSVIRVEDDYLESYKEKKHKRFTLNDIYESITEDIELDSNSNDSDSAESEIDPLSREEEANAIGMVIAAIEGKLSKKKQEISRSTIRKLKRTFIKRQQHKVPVHKARNEIMNTKFSISPIRIGQNRSYYGANSKSRFRTKGEGIMGKILPTVSLSSNRNYNKYHPVSTKHKIINYKIPTLKVNRTSENYLSIFLKRIMKKELGTRNNFYINNKSYKSHIVALNNISLPSDIKADVNIRHKTRCGEKLRRSKVIQGATKDFYLTQNEASLKEYYKKHGVNNEIEGIIGHSHKFFGYV